MTFREKRSKEWNIFVNQGKEATKELFSKKWYRQIPNLLTLSRGIAPFVIIPLVLTGNIIGAIIAEILFATTDLFDGLIARKFNFSSHFGKRLDTICDKIFAITLLIPIYTIMPQVIITILLELIISAINSVSTIKGNDPSSSLIGKTKTFFLSGSIILGYLAMLSYVPIHLITFSFAITSILQSGAVVDYYMTDKMKDLKKAEEKRKTNESKKQEENNNKNIKVEEKEIIHEIKYENIFPKENLTKTKKHLR